jgi:hypothetical protein
LRRSVSVGVPDRAAPTIRPLALPARLGSQPHLTDRALAGGDSCRDYRQAGADPSGLVLQKLEERPGEGPMGWRIGSINRSEFSSHTLSTTFGDARKAPTP